MTDRPTPPPPPPPGSLIRTADDGAIWKTDVKGNWHTIAARTQPGTSWERLARGVYGDVELLVPVTYIGDAGGPEFAQAVAETILNPVAAMMAQLAQAAGAAVTAMIGETYRMGRADGHRDGPGDPPRFPGEVDADG